jgi:hypothetical protein
MISPLNNQAIKHDSVVQSRTQQIYSLAKIQYKKKKKTNSELTHFNSIKNSKIFSKNIKMKYFLIFKISFY